MKKLLVVDGNSILYRGFYALPLLTSAEGIYTNAVYGFCNIFIKAIKDIQPDYVAVAFDYAKKTFRNDIYPEYKITRKQTPIELVMQFPIIKQVLNAMNIKYIEMQGYEGDDILGSLSTKFDIPTIILTGDRDTLQLINPTTKVYLTKKGVADLKVYDEQELFLDKGITPKQVVDVKAIMGDASDNIPGVKGIGEKGAYKLITQYGSLNGVYDNLDDLTPSLKEKLIIDKQNAFLSYELGTIKTDCKIDYDLEDFAFSLPFDSAFYDICKKYDFTSIMKHTDLFGEIIPQKSVETESINSLTELEELINSFTAQTIVSLVVLNESMQLSVYKGDVYQINMPICDYVSLLADLLQNENVKKLFFDLKDFKRKFKQNNFIYNNCDDVALMYYLLNANDKPFTAQDFMHIYSCENLALLLTDNYQNIYGEIKKNNLESLYKNIELPLIDVLFSMENNGIKLDEQALFALDKKISLEIEEITEKIYYYLGYEINLNSPKQLAKALFEDLRIFVPGNKKNSTSVEVLQKIENAHPVVPLIQKYRKLVKTKGTYIDVYIDSKKDGFIYTHFLQMVTGTGRLSSKDPNLQNIPIRDEESKEIRDVFTSRFSDGYLISFDYDQIELKLMAHFSGDATMINAFNANQDIHSAVASKIFGVPLEAVTQEQRRKAKTVNFGIIYGQTAFGLSTGLDIPVKEAQSFIDSYFATFPRVKEYMEQSKQKAKDNNFTAVTMFNRMRYIPELQSSNFQLRTFGERVAINMPLQGSASDIIKMAMIKVQDIITKQNMQTKLVLQIHDELVFDVPSDEVEQIKKIALQAMQNVTALSVPLTVSISQGKTLNKK